MMGTLVFLFLLYVAAIFVVAKRYTRNASDFIFLAVIGIAATPLISWMIGRNCEREWYSDISSEWWAEGDSKHKRDSDLFDSR
jgi:energy-coupling factor transporter transmembrane protein EcfT